MPKKTSDKNLQNYPIDLNLDDVHRAAAYLHWASRKFPGRPVPVTYIVRIANAMKTTPRDNNKAVEAFRKSNRMGRVRQILLSDYECELDYIRGVGYRCTTDSNDIMDSVVEKRSRAVRNAIARMDTTLSLVDPKKVTGKERKDRLRTLSKVRGALVSPDIKDRLLLKAPDED